MLRQRGFHEAKIHRALATPQHHQDFKPLDGETPTVFARILRVAEAYDTLARGAGGARLNPGRCFGSSGPTRARATIRSSSRPHQPDGQGPPEAPQLTNGQVVRVVSTTRSPETWDKPLTRTVLRNEGRKIIMGEEVDLATAGVGVANEL